MQDAADDRPIHRRAYDLLPPPRAALPPGGSKPTAGIAHSSCAAPCRNRISPERKAAIGGFFHVHKNFSGKSIAIGGTIRYNGTDNRVGIETCQILSGKGARRNMEQIQSAWNTLTRMQWSDYLDIIVVAYLIYRILPLIKNNGVVRIVRVIVMLFVVLGLAELWDLYALSYLLNQFMAVGLIALVILFQPELRRMLDHLGSVKLSRILGTQGSKQPELDPVIAQTVAACEVMSREKIGALIVFARENPVDEYFKTGTQIDGQVSEQLLRNIFFPKAALHDGAMIIRDGRVAAAGCVLPLSESNRLSADLGTRHRAGVGMSEASDAVVIIVSEETGTISVAVGGMLKRHLAPQTLEKLLHNELCPDPQEEAAKPLVRLRQKLQNKKEEQ